MRLLRSRWLRPHAPRLLQRGLWRVTPRGVAIGLAVGVFFGILVPFGQMFVALLAAALLRGNLALAVAGTLVTNPLTVPFVYVGAHRVGKWLLTWTPQQELDATVAAATQAKESLLAQLANLDFGAATLHLLCGLTVFAIVGAVLAYGAGFAAIAWRERRTAVPGPVSR